MQITRANHQAPIIKSARRGLGFLAVLLLCVRGLWGSVVDYENLDLKYYPYIMFYEASSDEEVSRLIRAVDNGESKSGLLLGFGVGGANIAPVEDRFADYVMTYSVKLGYQSFLPSFFDRLSRAGILGNRIYLQYLATNSIHTLFGSSRFSSILLGGDVLLEFPIMKKLDLGIIGGVGVGSMVYEQADSRLGFLLNAGIGTTFLSHNRLDFEMKFLVNGKMAWLGVIFMLGYSYVF